MDRKPRRERTVQCHELAMKACRELLIAAEKQPQGRHARRAIVLAQYALAIRS